MSLKTISPKDPDYPELLRHVYKPPSCLHVRGELPDFELHPAIAIVGSRKLSEYGRQNAHAIAARLANLGFTVVSGLAYGIDSVAHRAALTEKGKTIAVLASGLDIITPRVHKKLAEEIIENGGALISEYDLGFESLPHQFPIRNRIISGLSLGSIIIEAALESGSLTTARHAMEQGREVFAVPGPIGHINTAGPHRLIRDGAALIETAQEVVDILWNKLPLKWRQKNSLQFQDLDDRGQKILNILGNEPMDIDKIIELSGMTVADTIATLTRLECIGKIRQELGKGYIKI